MYFLKQGALSPTKSTRHPQNSHSPPPDLADSQVYLDPLYDQYFVINDLLPALRVGRGGARSRSTSYYTSVVTNNNHMLLTSLSVPCLRGGQSRIDRYSTCSSATATVQGREEVINHKILIIKGTKVDLAVRQVGRRGVRVLGVTGGFCGG